MAFKDRMASIFFHRHLSAMDEMTAVRQATGSMYASGAAAQAVPIIGFSPKSGTSASDAITQNPLMFSPIWRIVLTMGKLPLKVYRIDPATGKKAEALDHPAYALLRSPNPILPRNLMISGTVASIFQYGRVGWYKNRKLPKGAQRASGKIGPPPVELWPIPGNMLFPIREKDSILAGYEIRAQGGVTPLKLEDVCYFRFVPSPDDWASGMSPMTALAAASDYGSEAIDAATDFFKNALLSRQWLDVGQNKTLETPARLRLQAQLQIAREDRYAVPILEDGAQLRDMGHGPNDLVLVRAVENAARIIDRAFGMPLVDDVASLPYFYGEVITPVADALEQELERSLFNLDFVGDPAFAEFQFREILAGDPLRRAQLHQIKILSMQETPDEARTAENEEPLNTPASSALWGPLNSVMIDMLASGQGRPPRDSAGGQGGQQGKGGPTAQPSPGGANDNAPAALQAATANGEFRARFAPQWGIIRTRSIEGRAEAARRQMQGQLKNELKAIRARLRTSEKGVKVDQLPWPTPGELAGVMQQHERAATEILQAFMDSVGEDSWREASSLFADQTNPDWEVPRQPDQVSESYRIRAGQVADAFAGDRANAVERLMAEVRAKPGATVRDFDSVLHETYQTFATRMSGIASTELSWAFEQAAIGAWLQAGVRTFDYIYDGGPCTTGVCESAAEQDHVLGEELENVGASFTGARFAPLHPGCGCYVIPQLGAITNPVPAGVGSQAEGG